MKEFGELNQGGTVSVLGFLHIGFEDINLYSTEADARASEASHCLGIELNSDVIRNREMYNERWVILQGTYSPKLAGEDLIVPSQCSENGIRITNILAMDNDDIVLRNHSSALDGYLIDAKIIGFRQVRSLARKFLEYAKTATKESVISALDRDRLLSAPADEDAAFRITNFFLGEKFSIRESVLKNKGAAVHVMQRQGESGYAQVCFCRLNECSAHQLPTNVGFQTIKEAFVCLPVERANGNWVLTVGAF